MTLSSTLVPQHLAHVSDVTSLCHWPFGLSLLSLGLLYTRSSVVSPLCHPYVFIGPLLPLSLVTWTPHWPSDYSASCGTISITFLFWLSESPRSLTPHQVLISQTHFHSPLVSFVLFALLTVVFGSSHSYLSFLVVRADVTVIDECIFDWRTNESREGTQSDDRPKRTVQGCMQSRAALNTG